jgi:hypothetical protein
MENGYSQRGNSDRLFQVLRGSAIHVRPWPPRRLVVWYRTRRVNCASPAVELGVQAHRSQPASAVARPGTVPGTHACAAQPIPRLTTGTLADNDTRNTYNAQNQADRSRTPSAKAGLLRKRVEAVCSLNSPCQNTVCFAVPYFFGFGAPVMMNTRPKYSCVMSTMWLFASLAVGGDCSAAVWLTSSPGGFLS